MALYKQVGGERQELPTHWTFADLSYTGNFRDMGVAVWNAEGWFVCVPDPEYDQWTEKLGEDILTVDQWERLVIPQTAPELEASLLEERQTWLMSRLQFRQGVNALGVQKRTDLDNYINGLTRDEQDEWLHQGNYGRLDALIVGIGVALGFSDAQLDNFFRTA